jgi:hypothetical protein
MHCARVYCVSCVSFWIVIHIWPMLLKSLPSSGSRRHSTRLFVTDFAPSSGHHISGLCEKSRDSRTGFAHWSATSALADKFFLQSWMRLRRRSALDRTCEVSTPNVNSLFSTVKGADVSAVASNRQMREPIRTQDAASPSNRRSLEASHRSALRLIRTNSHVVQAAPPWSSTSHHSESITTPPFW